MKNFFSTKIPFFSRLNSETAFKDFVRDDISRLKFFKFPTAEEPLLTAQSDDVDVIRQTENQLTYAEFHENIDMKLKCQIHICKNLFRRQVFIAFSDRHTKTIMSNKIDRFFTRFEADGWFFNFNLMSLIFYFNWPSITLILHSFYTSFLKNSSKYLMFVLNRRWSFNNNHDCVVFFCCFHSYWFLFDIDFKCKVIQHYDFLIRNISESQQLLTMIEKWLMIIMQNKIEFIKKHGIWFSVLWFFSVHWQFMSISKTNERGWLWRFHDLQCQMSCFGP